MFILLALLNFSILYQAKLIIHSPKRLVELFPSSEIEKDPELSRNNPDDGFVPKARFPGFINASYANFGFIPYGHSMVGRLYYDKKLDTMCETIPPQDFNFNDNSHGRRREITTPFMIADRGNCTFV